MSNLKRHIPETRNPKEGSICLAILGELDENGFIEIKRSESGRHISWLRPSDFDFRNIEPGQHVVAYYNQSNNSGLWRVCEINSE